MFDLFGFGRVQGNDIGVDLGTVNTLICTATKGVVLREPSVVAIDTSTRPAQVIEVGLAAREMMGRTPANIRATRPLKDGVIAEFEWAEQMLRKFVEKVTGGPKLFGGRPGRIIVGIPSGVTEVERRAVGDAAYAAGARIVHLVDEPMAAAIGAGMPVMKPTGSMIVDIGGGTTEIAVLSLNGIVISKSLRVAGDELNENIVQHLKKAHNLSIGERTAEAIKIRLGSATKTDEDDFEDMEVRGLNLLNGLPHTIRIHSAEIRDCMRETLIEIVEGIKSTLEVTPPELAADIVDRGIVLAGGGALLTGLDELIAQEVDVPVFIANDPLSCVVLGTEKILTDPQFTKILEYTEYDPRG
ncbi:MAG: rod shape-determining protein [Vampirovibrionales bacterium]|nr:rod shape-determining protein [Vampirovibrionales bacterium]